MIKIYINKHGNIDKFELPSGEIHQRNYGTLPNMHLLEEYEEQNFEMYNHKGEIQFEATLLEVLGINLISYDVIKRYVEVDEE